MKAFFSDIVRSRLLFGCLVACTMALSFTACKTSVGLSYQNYAPPPWAPPYDNVSGIHYYYFPDYSMYYDAWDSEFWYLNNGVWISSIGLPPMYADIDLYASYIVLINSRTARPWENHAYYAKNYPPHCYDNYRNIVVSNRIVRNIADNHELVTRAFNENNNRVTFMQRLVTQPPVKAQPLYHHVSHEVPMENIAPHMPAESRGFNYGGGFKRR